MGIPTSYDQIRVAHIISTILVSATLESWASQSISSWNVKFGIQLQATKWLRQNLIKALTCFQNGKCEYLEVDYQQLSCVFDCPNSEF